MHDVARAEAEPARDATPADVEAAAAARAEAERVRVEQHIIAALKRRGLELHDVHVHASPPCQRCSSAATNLRAAGAHKAPVNVKLTMTSMWTQI